MSGLPGIAYRQAILLALSDMPDRRGSSRDVLDAVEKILAGRLRPSDYEREPKGMIRWVHRVHTQRNLLVHEEGLLKNDSPRGIWELAEGFRVYRIDLADHRKLTSGKEGGKEQEVQNEEGEDLTTQEQRIAELERRVAELEAALAGWRKMQTEVAVNLRRAVNALEGKGS